MQGRNRAEPMLFQMVDLEALVPPDHWLRRLDAVLDLSFVHEAVAECYSPDTGRPSVDPELALRMLILAELYGLPIRELCRELGMHAGMRWFCRLNFHDEVPDHSTLSRLKNERWVESGLFDRLHEEVVRQCCEAGLVSGRHLSLDGTEVEADASMKSLKPRGPRLPDEPPDPPPRGGGGRKVPEPQPEGAWTAHGVRISNRTHRSTTDPDARLYRKGDNRGARLSYLAHDLIDTKSRVILKRRASRASSAAEREVGLAMVDEVLAKRGRLGLPNRPEILTADAGYGAGKFVADLLDREILPHVPLVAGAEKEEIPTWKRSTTRLDWKRKRAEKVRIAKARNRVRECYGTRGYQVSRRLRTRSELGFAEAKTQHGLGRTRVRGLERVDIHMQLKAVVQNLKRLAGHVRRERRRARGAALGRPEPRIRLFVSIVQRLAPVGRLIRRVREMPHLFRPFRSREMAASSTGF